MCELCGFFFTNKVKRTIVVIFADMRYIADSGVIPQGSNLIYFYLEVWVQICKMYPYEHLPESLKINPYWSNEIRKRPRMEYDTTSYITSVALRIDTLVVDVVERQYLLVKSFIQQQ